MNYKDEFQLNYKKLTDLEYIDNELDFIKLYHLGEFLGFLKVYTDWENDQQDYVCINYETIYLSRIKQTHTWL